MISRGWKIFGALLPLAGSLLAVDYTTGLFSSRESPFGSDGIADLQETNLAASLVGWYPFTSSANATNDGSPAWNNTLVNPIFSLSPVWSNTAGGVLSFSGTNAYATASDTPTSLTTNSTLSCWAMTTLSGSVQIAFARGQNDAFGGMSLRYDGAYWTAIIGETGSAFICTSSNATPTGVWVNVAATFSNGNVRLYLDGVQVGSGVTDLFGGTITTNRVCIGSWLPAIGAPVPRYFYGLIDEPQIFTRVLTSNEVATYLFGVTGQYPRVRYGK